MVAAAYEINTEPSPNSEDHGSHSSVLHGQNVLRHSIEVAKLAGIMASRQYRRRAGFSDIGKLLTVSRR